MSETTKPSQQTETPGKWGAEQMASPVANPKSEGSRVGAMLLKRLRALRNTNPGPKNYGAAPNNETTTYNPVTKQSEDRHPFVGDTTPTATDEAIAAGVKAAGELAHRAAVATDEAATRVIDAGVDTAQRVGTGVANFVTETGTAGADFMAKTGNAAADKLSSAGTAGADAMVAGFNRTVDAARTAGRFTADTAVATGRATAHGVDVATRPGRDYVRDNIVQPGREPVSTRAVDFGPAPSFGEISGEEDPKTGKKYDRHQLAAQRAYGNFDQTVDMLKGLPAAARLTKKIEAVLDDVDTNDDDKISYGELRKWLGKDK